jgi:type I restriction enzyme M protein
MVRDQIIEGQMMPAASSFRLGQIAHVYSGSVGAAKIDKDAPTEPLRLDHRVLHPSFLQSPLLEVGRLPLRIDDARPRLVLQAGDIVGRDFASDRRWTVLPREYQGMQAGQGLLVVRVHEEVMPREYIAAYLSSSHAENSMPLTGSVMPRLTRQALADTVVPRCAGDLDTIRQVSAQLGAGPAEVGNITLMLAKSQSENIQCQRFK